MFIKEVKKKLLLIKIHVESKYKRSPPNKPRNSLSLNLMAELTFLRGFLACNNNIAWN